MTNEHLLQSVEEKECCIDIGELHQFRTKIASGELSAQAPCAGMHNQWTEEQKSRVTKALESIFDWGQKS